MKKVLNTFLTIATVFLLLGGATVQAQLIDFEDKTIGDHIAAIGWGGMVAEIAVDPLAAGNKVLKFTPNNYNAAPVLEVTLPAGKTLADYGTFKFKGYFAQGDVGWKDIIVEAYQTMPTGQAYNNAANKIGSWNRAKSGSTAWEDITISITGSSSLTGTIYLAFGINCAGTGDIGGTGVTTVWYADDIQLVLTPYVTQWGKTAQGTAWPLNTSITAAGEAGLGDGKVPTAWATIKGGFNETLEATSSQAVVVTGEMELVGGGGASAYTWMRYALTYQDSVELKYQGTDSATWVTTADSAANQNKHWGYGFHPRSGNGTMSNGAGGAGVVWTINKGSWSSTWSNNGKPISAVKQAPRNAVAIASTYKFAISVQPKTATTNEIRWYLIEKNNKYWFGGTVIDTATTTKFNGICFGFNKDVEATSVKFSKVQATLGSPITVPEAPWEPFYVDQWGKTAQGTAWPILWNDSDYVAGEAGIGDGKVPTGWATIKGGFGDPVQATTSKAIIVTGEMELVGGGGASAYTWMRYALTYQDSVELKYQGTDSATWVTTADSAANQNKHWGYGFHPRSGNGTMSNGAGGAGVVWTINKGSWSSTWSNNGKPISAVKQAPRNAVAIASTYKFAISVQPKTATTNEIRWYLIEKNNKYWFGGTVIDTATTTKFNGICFGFNKDIEATQVNFSDVKVDLGAPITVPEAPWEAFYVDQWGKTAQGTAWPILWNDSDYVAGEAGIGDGKVPTGWATIKGGFGDPVQATTSKAIIVTGEMELVGGGGASAYTWFRYALTYQDSVELKYQGTDTANWVTTAKSSDYQNKHFGYLFTPVSGAGTMSNSWRAENGGSGTVWLVNNGSWTSTNNPNSPTIAAVKQAPRNAVAIASTYKFAISVQPKTATTNEIRWYLIEKNNKYWFGGTVIDTTAITTKFNGICFGFNKDIEATQVNFSDVKVDLGAPITVPEAPWEAYYVDQWGFSGRNLGGWNFVPGEMNGDAEISGTAAPTGWAALRGGFDPYTLNETYALKVSGQIELVGGGFQDAGSLRYGLFYSDSAGTTWQDSTLDSNWVWRGTDRAHSGYLITPPSGSNVATWSNGKGTWGSITNGKWWDISAPSAHVLGNIAQDPVGGVAGAGTYDFTISISKGTSGNLLVFTLSKKDGTYYYAHSTTTPVASVTDKINSIGFAINNSTTTALKVYEVKVDRGPHFNGLEEAKLAQLPTVYALKQNYPNPFNPTTNIRFDLPKDSDVNLVVYDLMGREVAKLVNGHMNAGYYTINFNAANLPSGVYIYRLKAGDFVSTKKLMLLK